MASYGYRLFKIEIREGNRRKAHPMHDCSGEHYSEILARLFKSLSVEARVGKPSLRSGPDGSESDPETDPDDLAQEPVFRVQRIENSERVVRAAFDFGRYSDYTRALGKPGISEDLDLSGHAPSREFRAIFALPYEGDSGVLAVEDVSRTCPVGTLVRWLTWQSQKDALAVKKEHEGSAPWWKIAAAPLADEKHLQKLIDQGEFERLELVKYDIGPDRTRNQEYFRLTAPHVQSQGLQLGKIVKGWFNKDQPDVTADPSPKSDAEGAKELAAILTKPVQALDFDDGWVVLKDGDGKTKKISPTRMSEFFIYSIGTRATDYYFYDQVRMKALSIQAALDLDIDWPSVSD